MPSDPLKFKVAPNIVQDLGLNLYTSLPRVLAEFVANAYDADSPAADITFDYEAIAEERRQMRERHREAAKQARKVGDPIEDLAGQTLPASFSIVIEDSGCGMSRDDLATKFLVAGRRRRVTDPSPRTPKKRLIMGRKGLGKLAGFGVAKRVELVTRKEGESHATKITLLYDELVSKNTTEEIPVHDTELPDGGGFATSGTRIILSELLYDPAKSQGSTVSNELADHFEMIRIDDFAVRINGKQIELPERPLAFAWPKPELALNELVDESYTTEEGVAVAFKYRMRFTADEKALSGQRRGVRVYARGRLASAPSLLDADTNMHGFRMTDYLDGVVEADELDAHNTDFIATDRQSLRWESPLLTPLKEKLSAAIRESCKEYQKVREGKTPGIVKNDPFTLEEIKRNNLEGRDRTLALRIGTVLANGSKQGVSDPLYRTKFPAILRGIGQGNLLAAIAALAAEEHPDLQRVAAKIIELTHEEIEGFASIARGRVNAIDALKKIVQNASFTDRKDEKKIQGLLEKAPWMVDPTYGPTVSANESINTLFAKLAKELRIGAYAPADAEGSDDRPDLVFLLGTSAIGRLVIVELKAANLSLESEHLDQLFDYMERASNWLSVNAPNDGFVVHGYLIGMLKTTSMARGHRALVKRMKDAGPDAKWRVRTFMEVLNDTQRVHAELLAAYPSPDSSDADDADEESAD